jgi:hypothetical protein
MNSAQHAAMELLANMAKPDVAEAERCLELSQSLELPPRVIGEIEEYIQIARGAGNMAHAAKLANERATKCWQAVKEQASRVDDLVDMAQSATKAAEVVHATTAVDGAPEAAVDESADPVGDLARAYDAGLGDGIIEDAHREADEAAAEQSMIDEFEEGDDDAHAG